MQVEQFHIEGVETADSHILYVRGELDLSVVPQFRTVLGHVVNQTDKSLIINLKDLKYIDSTGIGIIVSVLKIRDGLKAPFYVQDIPPSVKRLFDLTGISGYLSEGTEN